MTIKEEIRQDTPLVKWLRSENNVVQTPNWLARQTENAQLSENAMQTVGGTWTSRLITDQWLGQPTDTAVAAPPNLLRDWFPDPASPVVASATGNSNFTSFRDWTGRVRPANASRGALEPAA